MYQGKFEKRDTAERKTPTATAPSAAPADMGSPRRSAPAKRRKKASTKWGTVLFYSIYALCIVAFFVGLMYVMDPLEDWLIKYEASQPNHKRDEVFAQIFADPDWEAIYRMAGVEDTKFENSKSFASAMEKLVGDTELTCVETSAGLSGDKKFIVKLGDDKIASFTLTGGASSQTEIPEWELGTVEVFFQRTKSITVERFPGQTVLINGVALDDSYVIRTTSTVAEDYLPEGVHGFRLEQLYVTDLLVEPEITLKNADGSTAQLIQNEETGIYSPEISTAEPTEEEKLLALNATKAYAEYMIGKTTLGAVQKHFDTKSQFYETIRRSEVGWVQAGASYAFTEPQYSDFYRYSDTLFSIRLEMTLQQTRFGDGSVKNYNLNNTMFFQKNDQGTWLVMEATNVAVQELVSHVRIVFMDGENVLSNQMVNAAANSLILPAVTAPEGKTFAGWVKQEINAAGQTTLTVVFEASEENIVYLPSDTALEPMVLHPLYEEAKSE